MFIDIYLSLIVKSQTESKSHQKPTTKNQQQLISHLTDKFDAVQSQFLIVIIAIKLIYGR